MATEQLHGSADVRAARERYVPRGIATTDFVVARADGATLWDADGNEVLDFAGGIACQNLGHNPEAVVRAKARRRRCSSTRAPRRSRTLSRSRAPRPDGRASSSSTAPSTAAPT